MKASTLGRLAPLAGLAYAVATVAGDLTIGKFPDSGTPLAQLTAFYSAHHTRVAAGGLVFAWATILLAIFGCALWSRARERGVHPIVGAAILVATAVAIVADVEAASTYWLLGHISTESGVTPTALQALHTVGAEGGFGVGVTLLLLAIAAAGVLPRWLSWPGAVLGIAQLVPGIGFFASLVFLLWAAVAGVVLAARPGERRGLVPAVA